MDKSNKMPMIIIAVVVLIVIAIIVSVVMNSGDDTEKTPATDEQSENAEDNTDADGEKQDENAEDDTGSATENPTLVNLNKLNESWRALKADYTAAIDAGCGDDVEAFNKNVVELTGRLANLQSESLEVGQQLGSLDESSLDEAEGAALKKGTEDLATLTGEVEALVDPLAEVSSTCNN